MTGDHDVDSPVLGVTGPGPVEDLSTADAAMHSNEDNMRRGQHAPAHVHRSPDLSHTTPSGGNRRVTS